MYTHTHIEKKNTDHAHTKRTVGQASSSGVWLTIPPSANEIAMAICGSIWTGFRCTGHGLTKLYTLLLGRPGCCTKPHDHACPFSAGDCIQASGSTWNSLACDNSATVSPTLRHQHRRALFHPVMHIRVAGLINLIGVVARLIKEKEETVVDLELLCHTVYSLSLSASLSIYLSLS